MKKILVALLCLFAFNCGYAKVFKFPDKPISLKKGESEFTIVLESNPSTGYAWFLAPYPENFLTLTSHKYHRDKAAKPGTAGEESWTFEVSPKAQKGPMVFSISFVYMRTWEADKAQSAEVIILTQG